MKCIYFPVLCESTEIKNCSLLFDKNLRTLLNSRQILCQNFGNAILFFRETKDFMIQICESEGNLIV